MIDLIGRGVDRAVSIFSPGRAIMRAYDRERLSLIRKTERAKREAARRLKKRSAQYAAAKSGRLVGPWSTADSPINDIIAASSPQVRARVRQLIRDFPFFAGAIDRQVEHTVGDGIIYQSQFPAVDDFIRFWFDEADVAGKLHYYELMQLARRQSIETGEFLVVKVWDRRRTGRFLPYGLQLIEPDFLAGTAGRGVLKRNAFEQGIEYDPRTGAVEAYHIIDPDSWGDSQRIKAENVIHGFRMLRPGQFRGISDYAPAALVAHDLQEMMDATIDAAKLASKYLALITTPNPLERQTPLDLDDDDKLTDNLENAVVEYLRPGETVQFPSNTHAVEDKGPFFRLLLQMVSVVSGVPYEIVSGDYTGLSYSNGKMIRNDWKMRLKPQITRHVRQFGTPTTREAITAGVLAGRLSIPGFWNNPHRFTAGEWTPPGMESIDPLRETKAHNDQLKNKTRSPQEIARARGRDIVDILDEWAAFKKLCDDRGLDYTETKSVAMANNPAAVDQQK